MTPEDILRDAAMVIEKYGHTKANTYRDDRGHFCALGAIVRAAGKPLDDNWRIIGDVWRIPEFEKALNCLIEVIPDVDYGFQVADWNDSRASKAQVIAKLREAADLAATRSEEQ